MNDLPPWVQDFVDDARSIATAGAARSIATASAVLTAAKTAFNEKCRARFRLLEPTKSEVRALIEVEHFAQKLMRQLGATKPTARLDWRDVIHELDGQPIFLDQVGTEQWLLSRG